MMALGQCDLTSALWDLEQTFAGLTTRNPLKEVRAPRRKSMKTKRVKTNNNTKNKEVR